MIYGTILSDYLTESRRYFVSCVEELSNSIVDATLVIIKDVFSKFLPTSPLKFHYALTFNLRHLQSVFQGLALRGPRRSGEKEDDDFTYTPVKSLIQLWLHECTRVLSDGLSSEAEVRAGESQS